ncbi:MAG: VWA domain-containing protein [Acidobacteria bacterium]|nr:VWA domain-containing protein [Acidobacteriota bacterium]
MQKRRNWNYQWKCVLISLMTLLSLIRVPALSQAKRPDQLRIADCGLPTFQINRKSQIRNPQSEIPPTPAQSSPNRSGQPSTQTQGTAVELSAHLVVVPVSATDASGQPVLDLTVEDFVLEEEGRRQQIITLGAPGKTPVELALLFDISGSVFNRFQFAQQAALRFLQEVLKPNDAVSIFSISLTPKLVQPRTKRGQEAITDIMTIEPTREATAFFDAVAQAARYLESTAAPNTRHVEVVISDGEDNHSERDNLARALRELQQADCLFYAINPSGPSIRLNKISLKGQEAMETLASQTGGAVFLLESDENLDAAFRQIAAELQAQYLLGYYPTDESADGRFRRISVRVPTRPYLRVRARQGYYAPRA